MTRKILILGRTVHPQAKETATEIYNGLQEFFADDYKLYVSYYRDLVFDIAVKDTRIKDTRNNLDLRDYDAILMTNWFSHASIRKDVAYTAALYLRKHGVAFFNTESYYSRSTSKLSQMMLAALNGVAVPRTVFSLSFGVLQQALASDNHTLGTPFVLKAAQGSRGRSNYLLRSMDELANYASAHTEQHAFMAQSFVPSDHSDFRFFIVGNKVQFIIRRIGSADSHLFNTSQGADTEIIAPDAMRPEVRHMAEHMAGLLHREVTGLDIIFNQQTNEAYFLEANPIPQIATGSNVSLKLSVLADMLKRAAERK